MYSRDVQIQVTIPEEYWIELRGIVRAVVQSELAREREDLAAIRKPLVKRLTVRGVCQAFGFTEKQIRNRIHTQSIPVHRDRGSVYFLEHEVAEWLGNGCKMLPEVKVDKIAEYKQTSTFRRGRPRKTQ